MITSTSNQQMKDLAALLKKSKERKVNKAFVVEGTKMVAEAPKNWLRKVYVSEGYEKNPENQTLLKAFQKMHPLMVLLWRQYQILYLKVCLTLRHHKELWRWLLCQNILWNSLCRETRPICLF